MRSFSAYTVKVAFRNRLLVEILEGRQVLGFHGGQAFLAPAFDLPPRVGILLADHVEIEFVCGRRLLRHERKTAEDEKHTGEKTMYHEFTPERTATV
jgi:hypothetical protein